MTTEIKIDNNIYTITKDFAEGLNNMLQSYVKEHEQVPGKLWEIVEQVIDYSVSEGCRIVAVKVLSTGDVFRIGDKVVWDWCVPTMYITIKSLSINKKGELCMTNEQGDGINHIDVLLEKGWNFRHYEEPKPVLLTTEDGVEITNPKQLVWGFSIPLKNAYGPNLWQGVGPCTVSEAISDDPPYIPDMWFSTELHRYVYIRNNKPCLSIKDVSDLLQQTTYIEGDLKSFIEVLQTEVDERMKR